LFLILPLAACAKLGIPDYTLTVVVEPGVTGTPAAGVYAHPDLEQIDYKYTPLNPLHTVEVVFEGGTLAASGSVTVYNNFTLTAKLVDIRGTWKMISRDKDSKATEFTVTFAGADILGGAFSDSRGYKGTWTGKNNVLVFTYADWEAYVYSGTIFKMGSGTWANGEAKGTWSASRVS
jgi:hypothetical protein